MPAEKALSKMCHWVLNSPFSDVTTLPGPILDIGGMGAIF